MQELDEGTHKLAEMHSKAWNVQELKVYVPTIYGNNGPIPCYMSRWK
jgi:hypothetical protein